MSADELDVRAERIAQAALKFFVLRFTPRKSFEYDPKQSIDFNGQTGPYCLYTYARTRSLVRKSGWVPEFDPELVGLLQDEQEKDVVRRLFDFSDVVERSVESLDPSKVAEYTYDLAATFARMFTDRNRYPILGCEEKLTRARLMLADAVGTAVRSGLALLGIETLEEM
jgi:arginyl-tRNA synthetase